MTGETTITAPLKKTGHELLDAFVEYVVPIAAGAAGFFTISATVGGFNTVWGLLDKLPYLSSNTNSSVNRVAGIILGVVYGGIGFALWRLGKSGNTLMKLLGRGLGAYFF